MNLKIYNTLSRKKEEFIPIKKGKVGMYVCGPTVNDVPHLGHARVQIVFDSFRKYLEYKGYEVNFVSNVTDIEDKIILKSNELGISIKELTEKNLKEHLEDYASLGVKKPTFQPRASEYVDEMISLIENLEKKGYIYVVKNDGIYFDISKFKGYGKLSKINLDELKNKRDLRDSSKGKDKKDSKDFVLWKFSKEGEPFWNSPWGKGRPGWHIECSAMSHKLLGLPFDIHAGGQDLIFPHHEDEIAQSEAGYGKKFVNYWMHNAMVNINKVKMSKSLKNFTTIKEILKDYEGEIIRYFTLNTHYRKPMDFSKEKLNEAKISLDKLRSLCKEVKPSKKDGRVYFELFEKEMNQDFNTSGAINIIWRILREKEDRGKYVFLKEIDLILGFGLFEERKIKIPSKIKALLSKREEARKMKDFKLSDEIREEIRSLGFQVSDTKEGQELNKL